LIFVPQEQRNRGFKMKLPSGEKIKDFVKKLMPDIPEEKTAKIKDEAFAVKDFVYENLIVFIIGAVCIVIVLLIAVLVAMNFGGMKTRVATITEISGEANFVHDSRQYSAVKNAVIRSGDVITVKDGGQIRLKLDPDKYLVLEGNTSLYVDYTDIEERGAISVNLLYGSVISRLDKPIGEKDLFAVVTPNGTIETKDAVFRTTFTYYEDYAEGLPAKITDTEDFSGNLTLQLYDDFGEKNGTPMIQTERTEARMITTPGISRFGKLNLELDISRLSENSLGEILRISGERKTAYDISELNSALKIAAARNYTLYETPTLPTDINTEQIIITASTAAPPPTQATQTTTEATTQMPEVTETVPTTAHTFGSYTEYTGEQWWLGFGTSSAQTTESSENGNY
jgi:hypothetical protein